MKDHDPWLEGFEAYDFGQPITDNPYHPETEEEAHADWNDGWHASQEQDDSA